MHVIACQESIRDVEWPEIRLLIHTRWIQNELNKDEQKGFIISSFIVVEANDPMHLVEHEIRSGLQRIKTDRPIDEEFIPSFEWIIEHPSCYEVAIIHCDREYGICVLIPKAGIDPELLELCAEYVIPVPA